MAIFDRSNGTTAAPQVIATNLTGNNSSDIINRGKQYDGGSLTITTTVGATPTVTVNIQGSMDGSVWYNVPYALVATPRTFVITAITITTATTNTYLLQELVPYQYFKFVTSANTNVTITTASAIL